MPRLSAWLLRAALLNLAFGWTFGALLLWNKGQPPDADFVPAIWRLLPAHMELLLVGWTVQLAMGVAFWILPGWRNQRGDERPAWAAFVLLNSGVLLVVAASLVQGWNAWAAAGRALEALAAAAFALHAWPRVKPWVEGGA